MTDSLASIATGRSRSLLGPDLAVSADAIRQAVEGARVLVIGGAGSIGAATVAALLPFVPAGVDVIDHDENGLAELVRDLRNRDLVPAGTKLRCLPLDYGSPITQRFLGSAGRYDSVLHFAALKHVRSEKDAASVLQMIDTNVLRQRRLMDWLAGSGAPASYFAVSTDKAANPVSFMGASKRLMELAIFTRSATPLDAARRTSARFANVAFSAGSLLASWRERIEKRQPLAVPRDTRRYFVSTEEAAGICLLAAFVLGDAHVAIPRLVAAEDLRELTTIAESFVRASGRTPAWYDDEASARAALAADVAAGRWPVLRTSRDTEGEKPEEEFVARGETAVEVGWSALRAIPQAGANHAALLTVLDQLEVWITQPTLRVDRAAIAELIGSVVPEFAHEAAGLSLDDRM